MTYTAPDHYSYKFKFDIEKLPASQKDRIPCKLAVWGILFGLVFTALGLFEAAAYFFEPTDADYSFNLPEQGGNIDVGPLRYSFDIFVFLFGLIIIALSVMGMLRYKKIFFDGSKVKIIHKPLFGEKQIETEDLYNYLGVLFKVEYYQLGLINRNRYIIELYHADKNKRIPLYISTSGRNIRKIWEYYAAKLKMPALFLTDKGLVSRNHKELKKTLKEMAKKWQLKALYQDEQAAPESVKFKVKKNKVIVKEKHLFFDAYSLLACLGVIFIGSAAAALIYFHSVLLPFMGIWWYSIALAFCAAVVLFSVISIFSKDVLIVTGRDIILGHNIMFLRMDAEFLPKNQIEAVDVGHNPTTDRYYLSVISHDRSMVFGKNMPVDDLRWVRGYIIREIVRQD
ncbi:MAG TPA: hypothetical protein DD619_02475 [Alphaproteobacteria bacterium]|nr:hypothetical protein [Alphaproteobacteria bacterium]